MLFSGKQLIVTVAGDNTQINTTSPLTDFWQSNIRIVLGGGATRRVPCDNGPIILAAMARQSITAI